MVLFLLLPPPLLSSPSNYPLFLCLNCLSLRPLLLLLIFPPCGCLGSGFVFPLLSLSLPSMGSLPANTPCFWCGRKGSHYIPDGVDEPLCGPCLDALVDGATRASIISSALSSIFLLFPRSGSSSSAPPLPPPPRGPVCPTMHSALCATSHLVAEFL